MRKLKFVRGTKKNKKVTQSLAGERKREELIERQTKMERQSVRQEEKEKSVGESD